MRLRPSTFIWIKNQKGFTLVELVLYIVISGIILATASHTLVSNLEAYTFISNRQASLADARYALTRMSQETLHVDTGDIIAINGTDFQFTDTAGNATSFSQGTFNGQTALLRGAEPLIYPISGFQVNYYDQNGNLTALLNEVRSIEYTISTQPVAGEGTITLNTTVTPRNFIYENYQ